MTVRRYGFDTNEAAALQRDNGVFFGDARDQQQWRQRQQQLANSETAFRIQRLMEKRIQSYMEAAAVNGRQSGTGGNNKGNQLQSKQQKQLAGRVEVDEEDDDSSWPEAPIKPN